MVSDPRGGRGSSELQWMAPWIPSDLRAQRRDIASLREAIDLMREEKDLGGEDLYRRVARIAAKAREHGVPGPTRCE